MAYPPTRSMGSELNEGATDGKYKKVIRDRGGFVENTTWAERVDLAPEFYGIHEDTTKVRPDAKAVHTPETVTTPRSAGYFPNDASIG